VPGEDDLPSPGYYECAESAGPVRGENACAWWYDWVPVEGRHPAEREDRDPETG
jgi:hypothetical protein